MPLDLMKIGKLGLSALREGGTMQQGTSILCQPPLASDMPSNVIDRRSHGQAAKDVCTHNATVLREGLLLLDSFAWGDWR